eukprot:CAMPEP_0174341364 /NCGR_PEP_ID=MMETSP0810-20121108/25375_1 /TAXON_ID=73025 ORGANISM="Eutreptiella gymnastica-like, Strain CCMP1594" /NCGR_SAMPLE_ID=MMETSP0810 /ASSEMBLY_ACC=CAM_ASM_000659 /LENGTH=86 /DNA_ID=CAMNT_0015463001 /DNA_START=35 /DNA_END=295 /DNA_ORIENTATION=-
MAGVWQEMEVQQRLSPSSVGRRGTRAHKCVQIVWSVSRDGALDVKGCLSVRGGPVSTKKDPVRVPQQGDAEGAVTAHTGQHSACCP